MIMSVILKTIKKVINNINKIGEEIVSYGKFKYF